MRLLGCACVAPWRVAVALVQRDMLTACTLVRVSHQTIEAEGTQSGKPNSKIVIVDSGELKE